MRERAFYLLGDTEAQSNLCWEEGLTAEHFKIPPPTGVATKVSLATARMLEAFGPGLPPIKVWLSSRYELKPVLCSGKRGDQSALGTPRERRNKWISWSVFFTPTTSPLILLPRIF